MKPILALFATLLVLGCDRPGETPIGVAVEPKPLPPFPTIADAAERPAVANVEDALNRAAADTLNALISTNEANARRQAQALADAAADLPLAGVPFVVKDNIHVAGVPNTAGTPGLAEFVPDENNPVVQRLIDAGAIPVAKANLHELAFGITSDNAAYGAVGNPWRPDHFAGGSSGGTAAAVAAGIVPFGLGTDTGGSARIPAALTGIAGFRPSTDRYPTGAVTPISTTRDTVGPIARNVADLALVDAIVTGSALALPERTADSLRLGVPRDYFCAGLDAGTAAAFDELLERLAGAGVTLVDVEIDGIAGLIQNSAFPIALFEVVRDLGDYLAQYDTGLELADIAAKAASPDVQGVFGLVLGDGAIPQAAYRNALEARETLRERYARMFESSGVDALVFPTTPLPARPIAGSLETVELNGEAVPTFPTYIRNTDPATIAALPAVSLPAAVSADGLPVGLELDGPEGSDRELLAVAAAVERIVGFERTPPMRSPDGP